MITIGKDLLNTIVLQDQRISQRHAVIVKKGQVFFIYDNNSTNGTCVNNKRLMPNVWYKLPERCKLSLTPYILTCLINAQKGCAIIHMEENDKPAVTQPLFSSQSKLALFFRKMLVWESSHGEKVIKIGRQNDNDVVLSDSNVSRSHAVILRVGERFYVFDNGSLNGTYINNMKLSPKRQRRLPDECKLSIPPFTLTCKVMKNSDTPHIDSRVSCGT